MDYELPHKEHENVHEGNVKTEPVAENGNSAAPRPATPNGHDAVSPNTNSTSEVGQPDGTPQPELKPSDEPAPKKIKTEHPIVVVPPKKPDLFYSLLKTGLVYDVRMRYHAKIFTLYFEYIDPHPEDPRRIYRIYKKLAEAGLVQDQALSGSDDIGPLMVKIPIREATADEILEVHTREHLNFIELTEAMSRERLLEETEKGDSIYVNNDLYLLAKLSCGGLIEACKAVIEGRVKNSMAIVRPPGHHAEPHAPGGFCLFSNVAVAAKNILKQYADLVRRIVIVDWDIHHGNGTQRAFYDDPRVLYISLHRYENGRFYPGTKYGALDKVGDGRGEGFLVNIPWQGAGVGDGDYVYAFRKVVIPIILEFDPDLVIVSAGFDAADGDLIGQCHVTPAGYGHLTHMLKAVARGKLTVILEGGYNLDSISKLALGVAKVLVGEPPTATVTDQPRLDTIETVSEVIAVMAKYWKCMRPGHVAHTFDDVFDIPSAGVLSLSEPIRAYQAQELFTKHGFVSLPVVGNKALLEQLLALVSSDLPSHVEDLVLVSPDICDANTVVVSIHDPPEVWANVNPVNGSIESSTSVVLEHPLTRLMSRLNSEIEKEAAPIKIGHIDINVPSYTEAMAQTLAERTGSGSGTIPGSANSNYNPHIFAQELLLWVWDNYITYLLQLKKVVFVGYGEAYQAILHLLVKRPSQDIKDLVQGTVVFLNRSALKAFVPVMDESMVNWFYQNSVIFTSYLNPCWVGSLGVKSETDDVAKRPRKKFGRVIKASVDGFWEVLHERFDEGIDFMVDSVVEYSGSDSG